MTNAGASSAADIIIPVRNQFARTRALLEAIYRQTLHPFHLYVIDNNSSDETADLRKIYARDITVVTNRENRGRAAALNQGIGLGCNPHVVLLNPSVEVSTRWLEQLIAFLESHPRIGAVVPLSSCPDDCQFVDRVRKTSVPEIPHFFSEDVHERNAILEYHFASAGILVDGAVDLSCAALRRRALAEAGPLEESGGNGRVSADYCGRLRKAGYVLGIALDTYIRRQGDDGRADEEERQGRARVARGRAASSGAGRDPAQGTYM